MSSLINQIECASADKAEVAEVQLSTQCALEVRSEKACEPQHFGSRKRLGAPDMADHEDTHAFVARR
jgi:hypothetical protein